MAFKMIVVLNSLVMIFVLVIVNFSTLSGMRRTLIVYVLQ